MTKTKIMNESPEKPDIETPTGTGNPLLAGILAWILPGAGHIYIGKKLRGIIIMITIAVTFWAGMGMGGISTVDKSSERWWFLADLAAGAHGLTGWGMNTHVKKRIEKKILAGPLQQRATEIKQKIQSLETEGQSINREIDALSRRIRQTPDPEFRSSLQRDVRRLDQKLHQLGNDIIMRKQRLRQLKNEFIEKELVRDDIALVPPTATVARAYAGVAGLLNLMCIFDAVLLALMGRAKRKEGK